MKKIILATAIAAGATSLICGCNQSTPPPSTQEATSSTPAPTPVPAPATVVGTLQSVATIQATKLVEQAKAAADTKLAPIASDLSTKVAELGKTVANNEVVKSALDSTVKSLLTGQDASALTSVFKLSEAAHLTPEQITLAKEVGNLASAYVVEKNFASLDGSQSDVATIVKSLRDGQLTAALPAVKNVASNAKLTSSQKQLITSIADKYAPGWQKLSGAVDALKKLPGLN